MVPSECVDSGYRLTLLIAALSPIALIAVATAGLVVKRALAGGCTRRAFATGLLDAAPLALVITFYCVSSVSQAVFNSFLCDVYDEDSEAYTTRSFLRADIVISCDGGNEHERIKVLAYIFMALWPVGVVAFTIPKKPSAEVGSN